MVNFDNQYDQNNLNMMRSTIKIIDFGLSQYLPENKLAYSAAGTLLNADPLILKKFAKINDMDKKGYGKEIDIWSLGTICYEMLTGNKLFKADNMDELVDKLDNGTYKVPSNLSKETILFLESMLQYEGTKRSNINELENHPFLHKKFHSLSRPNSNIDISNKVNQLKNKRKSQDLDYYNGNGNSFKQKAISNEGRFISKEQNFFSQKSSNIFTNDNNNGRQITGVNNQIRNDIIDYQTFDVPITKNYNNYYNCNNFVKNYNRDFCDDDQKEEKACCNIQ
jgi:serine/threonine protein kinase